ncbi:MAG TPA: DNA gyrase modulator, partial [Nitrospiria bacterium]|nr:DNA gyrase modulator [Nitrospiria bacterium]
MTQELVKPEKFFTEKFGITSQQLEKIMGQALGRPLDDADLYFEYRVNESVSLEERLVKKAVRQVSQGVGVRAIAGEKTGYAYSDEITLKNIEISARTAKAISFQSGKTAVVQVGASRSHSHDLYPVKESVTDIPVEQKIELLHKIDALARQYDPRITKVMASIASEWKVILIATAGGVVVGDIQPLTRLQVSCIAEEKGDRQTGSFGGGGRVEYSYFLEG